MLFYVVKGIVVMLLSSEVLSNGKKTKSKDFLWFSLIAAAAFLDNIVRYDFKESFNIPATIKVAYNFVTFVIFVLLLLFILKILYGYWRRNP